MLFFGYDLLLIFSMLFLLPKFLWRRIVHGEYKGLFFSYFGLSLPKVSEKKGRVFLLHAVSMGETKAAASLFAQLKALYPQDQFYITSRTETGHAEAKRILAKADGQFLLPVDFSWAMRRFFHRLKPDVVVLVESEFWLHFLKYAKASGALVCLVSGRLSSRSFERFQKLSFFSRLLFSYFDLICVQNELFQEHFLQLGIDPSKVFVTGNLKLDTPFTSVDTQSLRQKMGIKEADFVLVIASTHPGEEEKILQSLSVLCHDVPSLKLLFVPRHPHRFIEVEEMLKKAPFPMIAHSRIEQKTGNEKIFLIDAMGLLLSFYQIADLAIVGGSFLPGLRGHNVFEPIQAGAAVIFGPYMGDQKDFVQSILEAQAGIQVSLEELKDKTSYLLQDPLARIAMQEKGRTLFLQMQGSSLRTCKFIQEKITFSERNH
ncbi:MAG: 3-deoxy-D-manno-octulosonic acid transferase [Rhabdochlamydiaceae bacterium]|nr:3-deoxy-D-manno-octulosonic acid transferase [Rhabdochlamydiaceae bacterium]